MKFSLDAGYVKRFVPAAIVLFGVAVATGAFLQALNFPFTNTGDDDIYVVNNVKLASLHLADLWRLFVEPYNQYEFLPLRDLSYWFDISLFGMTPAAFRLHSIFLYVICCLLVYATTLSLWRYFKPGQAASAPWVAATVAALFALHPSHVEAVVWISCRKDVLSGMFSMLAIWLALVARREHGLAPWLAGAALIALVAAILSKATVVMVAPVIAILWFLIWRDMPDRSGKRKTFLLWPLSSLLLAAAFATIFMGHSTVRLPAYFGIEAYTRALAIMGWMVRLAVTPESRHYYYPVFEDPWFWGMVVLGVTVLLAGIAGMVLLLRRRSLEGYALLVFVLLCMPYTYFLPYVTNSLVTDRFLFLALWPVLLLLVALVWRLHPWIRVVLLLSILLPWTWQLFERPNDWLTAETLLDRDMRTYPGYYLLATRKILWEHGPEGLTQDAYQIASKITDPEIRNIMVKFVRVDRAVNEATTSSLPQTIAYLQDLESDLVNIPARARWNTPLLIPFASSKKVLESEWLKLAWKFPRDWSVRYNAGVWLLDGRKYGIAATNLRAAAESPQLPANVRGKTLKYLGWALLKSGHPVEAEMPLLSALDQVPPDPEASCLLTEVYRHTGQTEKAAQTDMNCQKRQGMN